jgi:hypothetical protein
MRGEFAAGSVALWGRTEDSLATSARQRDGEVPLNRLARSASSVPVRFHPAGRSAEIVGISGFTTTPRGKSRRAKERSERDKSWQECREIGQGKMRTSGEDFRLFSSLFGCEHFRELRFLVRRLVRMDHAARGCLVQLLHGRLEFRGDLFLGAGLHRVEELLYLVADVFSVRAVVASALFGLPHVFLGAQSMGHRETSV